MPCIVKVVNVTIFDHFTFFRYIFHKIRRKTNKKNADEANKTTIFSFSFLIQLIVLLVSCVHLKTSTLTATGL